MDSTSCDVIRLRLQPNPVSTSGEEAQAQRDVVLQASPDGRTVVRVEFDERFSDHHATGPEQEVRHGIPVSELIQLIRAHGARL
ncbi:hypothetical protein [Paraburkholderia sp. BCC1885]|uniref:hypothetical protein n=1 Tax=Paraburkholderia sp. BCC1885 TaxID=2562669 RepID=UPI0011832547|nr:hypothetical protein [Paraburkholderia sp. BCC1885]